MFFRLSMSGYTVHFNTKDQTAVRTKCNRKVTAATASHFGVAPMGVSPTDFHIKNIGCELSLSLFLRTFRENIHPFVSLLENDHTFAGLKQQTFILSNCGAEVNKEVAVGPHPSGGSRRGCFLISLDFWCLLTASLQPASVFKVIWPSSLCAPEI